VKFNPFAAASALALILALGLAARITMHQKSFQSVVRASLASSEGYDQKFIDLVNHLEDVLTTRARFPYPGGKDPMTGRRREVAEPVLASVARRPAAAPAAPRPSAPEPPAISGPVDRVRLTAIIADEYGQHTAIVMDGERSLSVDVGDSVGPRKVLRITGREIAMEDDTTVYTYNLSGTRTQLRK
jgi:hypothetical protein